MLQLMILVQFEEKVTIFGLVGPCQANCGAQLGLGEVKWENWAKLKV